MWTSSSRLPASAPALDDVRPGAGRVSEVDAQADAGIQVLDRSQHRLRRGEVLILRAMVVNGDPDVVFLDKPFHRGQLLFGRHHDEHGHAADFRIVEIAADLTVAFRCGADHSTAHDPEARGLEFLAPPGERLRRVPIRQMKFLDADVRGMDFLDHLDRQRALELAKRIGRHAEFEAAHFVFNHRRGAGGG